MIDDTMKERMARVLYLFEKQGIRNVVLGSFGTGCFGIGYRLLLIFGKRCWWGTLQGLDTRLIVLYLRCWGRRRLGFSSGLLILLFLCDERWGLVVYFNLRLVRYSVCYSNAQSRGSERDKTTGWKVLDIFSDGPNCNDLSPSPESTKAGYPC
ncbi:hypothetical protein BDQ17DRAFT_1498306 [Cyathus striatus]|nr:hypothetical protein BDQ17DRAFT_1498306 [Cyathus striatus]